LNIIATIYTCGSAAQSKGLIAKGLKLSVSQLRTNNIVFLIINGEGHYCIVTNITDMMVYLADTDLGNINMTVTNFTAAYSGNALVVTNDTNDPQLNTGTELTNQEMQDIKGNGAWIKVWVYGWFWHWGKWVYGSWWSYAGHPKGNTHWFIWHRPSWHYKYGWFRIKYWHTIYIWCSGTLPMNYVRFFTPRSYESLHYWGQQ